MCGDQHGPGVADAGLLEHLSVSGVADDEAHTGAATFDELLDDRELDALRRERMADRPADTPAADDQRVLRGR